MKNILIGISGSIAAYKTILLIRELTKNSYNCKVVITGGGLRFVTLELIAGLGVEVYSDNTINLVNTKDSMLHINLAKWADLIIVAPASANTLAKLAHGMADNLLGAIILAATDKPKYIAPAMNYQMYVNSLTTANLGILKQHGFIICSPWEGIQACGDNGIGRMQEPSDLYQTIKQHYDCDFNQLLENKTIIITLGATMEAIDPVRYISNHSSGKMGLALITASLATGAKVIAIHAKINVKLPAHKNLTTIEALSAQEMQDVLFEHAGNAQIVIACAAVCDYRVKSPATQKIKKTTSDEITLTLIKNPDIITATKKQYPGLYCVGFAAETENWLEYATYKLHHKNLDLIIANQVSNDKGFNQDTNSITIIEPSGKQTHFEETGKDSLAREIIKVIGQQQQ